MPAETRRGNAPAWSRAEEFSHLRDSARLANLRKCPAFSHAGKPRRRDRTGWLGRQDSNLGMAETNPPILPFISTILKHPAKSGPLAINKLDTDSQCAVEPRARTMALSIPFQRTGFPVRTERHYGGLKSAVSAFGVLPRRLSWATAGLWW
jgi:hypothetical protein